MGTVLTRQSRSPACLEPMTSTVTQCFTADICQFPGEMVNLAKGGTKASEMAQLVKVLVVKVGELSFIPGTHMVEEEKVVRSLCAQV